MRLVAPLCLILALPLGAQAPLELPWRTLTGTRVDSAPLPAASGVLPLEVQLQKDGAFHIFDARGLRRMRGGLPGRPGRVYRDGGVPVESPLASMAFPAATPLTQGRLPLPGDDARPGLTGLLWVVDDGETLLAVLHPATGQMLAYRLPDASGIRLGFRPEGLDVMGRTGSPETQVETCWHVSWAAMLPGFLQLRRPGLAPTPGTVFNPFPTK